MQDDMSSDALSSERRAASLSRVLEQSKQVRDVVQECAKELSSVNADIQSELENQGSLPGVEKALKKNEMIEDKIHGVSARLSVVNVELKGEVHDRVLLEHQFAAAVEQEEAARHMALHDSLTDLPNRALFDDRLAHGLAHAKRHGWQMAVMFIDLDDFKIINDTHGHAIGDRILQIVGQRIASNTRSDDTVSRYGGDEFLFLLVEIENEADVVLVAQKILEMVQAPCDVAIGATRVKVVIKASIGIALYPRDGETAEQLMKKADTAMYQTKGSKTGFSFAGREALRTDLPSRAEER